MKISSLRNSPRLRRLIRQAESGAGGITFQVIGYVYLLTILLGLVYDFGAVIFTQTVLKSAVVVASQQLAKNVDRGVFLNQQEVRLIAPTLAQAQNEANRVAQNSLTMTAPRITITSARLVSQGLIDKIEVEGTAQANLPVLNTLLGFTPITIRASAVAAPEFGINQINQ